MAKRQKSKELAYIQTQSLTVYNPSVRNLAKRLKWKPETAVRRIAQALPAVLEQNIYLLLVQEWQVGVQPETFCRILRYINNDQEIKEDDFRDRDVGENLISNKGVEIVEQASLSLLLIQKSRVISADTAVRLAKTYGEFAEDIIDIVEENAYLLMGKLGLENVSLPKAMAIILKGIARQNERLDGRGGTPDITSAADIIALLSWSASWREWHNEDLEEY
jgi:hypothetical protein